MNNTVLSASEYEEVIWNTTLHTFFHTLSICVVLFLSIKLCNTPSNKTTATHVSNHTRKNPVHYSGDTPEAINMSRNNSNRQKTYHQGLPEGWYTILRSSDLKKGQVKYVEALDLSFAVFREEETGVVRILDSHCPHLGANLAIGGKVVGDCIECPFHGWRFKGSDGTCQHIPYCNSIPSVAKVQKWLATEFHGFICIYYSPDEERRENPIWDLLDDRIEELENGEFTYKGCKDFTVNMHIQEFAENSVDFQHFDPLHGQMTVPFTEIPIPNLRIRHQADWVPHPEKKYIANFYDKASLLFNGKEIPKTAADASITFLGPGGIVVFRFKTGLGEIILIQTHTPIQNLELKVQFYWYCEKKVPSLLASYVVSNWITQWKRDVMVWENKVYLNKPALAKNDGPVMKLRRWYSQFYPLLKSDW